MKTALVLFTVIVWSFSAFFPHTLFAEGSRETDEPNGEEIIIYAYDSFVAEWGPAGKIIPVFEEKTGIDVTIQSAGDAGQVLSRVIMESDNPRADIIIGIDNNMLTKALDADVLSPYTPENLEQIPDYLLFDPTHHVIPFDYGYFSIIYDSRSIDNPPSTLQDLTKPDYKDQLILMDPRTSSPGLGFFLWTIEVYGDDFISYWEQLKPSILTITEGWDAGYGLFVNGEAPMVLSYTTSPAYHAEYEESTQYKATLFEKGNYMQIEGMGIIKGAANRESAEKFIDFMLTEDFQSVIPLTNWMFPVNPDVKLPDSFQYALKPDKSFLLDSGEIEKNYDRWIDMWIEVFSD